jgi:hypothetical protein
MDDVSFGYVQSSFGLKVNTDVGNLGLGPLFPSVLASRQVLRTHYLNLAACHGAWFDYCWI